MKELLKYIFHKVTLSTARMLQLTTLTSILLATCALSSCGSEGDGPEPVPEEASRVVIVYMLADNSLGIGGYDDLDLYEMTKAVKAGDTGSGKLIVYHSDDNEEVGCRLLEITADGPKPVRNYPVNTSENPVKRMATVLSDVRSAYPSKDGYGLVLWSHGSGWIQDGVAVQKISKDNNDYAAPGMLYSFGQDASLTINVTDLAEVLRRSGHYDFIYFDCCYMGGIETIYELRDCADAIVASPTEIPVNGMPYDRNIKCFFSSEANLELAAQQTFESYDNLPGRDRTCTIAVYQTKGIDNLASATKNLYSACLNTVNKNSVQKFMTERNCYLYDFGHFINLLHAANPHIDPALKNAFDKALAEVVTFYRSTPYIWNTLPIRNFSGISTYPLENSGDTKIKNYDTLSWYRDVACELPLE